MDEKQLRLKHKGLLEKLGVMVKVDRANLSDEMAKNSSRMFNINLAKADAEFSKDKAESLVEVTRAKLDKTIRSEQAKRKPSEEQIKQRIRRNPDVITAQEKFFEAKWRFNVCWAAANAIHQKGEQLNSLGHILRREMESGNKGRIINSEVERLNKKGR